jgi:hypothetical protein
VPAQHVGQPVLDVDDLAAGAGGPIDSGRTSGRGVELLEAVAARLQAAMPADSSCSVGVAELRPGEAVGDLLRRADVAPYRVTRPARHGRRPRPRSFCAITPTTPA